MLTFSGHGYSAEFVANFAQIVERLRCGERVEIVDGPDDVCAPLVRDGATGVHCTKASVARRDAAARRSLGKSPGLSALVRATTAAPVDPAIIAGLRDRFADGSIRAACVGCEWSPLCTQIAAAGYARARL